jgi:hypothetical protein
LKFSVPQQKAILAWAKELGVKEVPTMDCIKKTQKRIIEIVGNPTEKHVATNGDVFYLNDVGKAISKVV